jgi:hypothetical protein
MSPLALPHLETAVTIYRDKYGIPTKCEVDGVEMKRIKRVEQITEVSELPMVTLTIYATVEYVDELEA